MNARRRVIAALSLCAPLVCVFGCQPTEKITYHTPRLLENLQGTKEGGEDLTEKRDREAKAMREKIAKATNTRSPDAPAANADEAAASAALDQSKLPKPEDEGETVAQSADARAAMATASSADEQPVDDPMVQVAPDGSVTLKTTCTRDLIAVLSRVINGEDDLRDAFYEQLISDTTKTFFRAEGKDPQREVRDFLSSNRMNINRLLGRLPGGENSPGVIVTSSGRSQFKVELTGSGARGLKLTELYVAFEGGLWKLVWIR